MKGEKEEGITSHLRRVAHSGLLRKKKEKKKLYTILKVESKKGGVRHFASPISRQQEGKREQDRREGINSLSTKKEERRGAVSPPS